MTEEEYHGADEAAFLGGSVAMILILTSLGIIGIITRLNWGLIVFSAFLIVPICTLIGIFVGENKHPNAWHRPSPPEKIQPRENDLSAIIVASIWFLFTLALVIIPILIEVGLIGS